MAKKISSFELHTDYGIDPLKQTSSVETSSTTPSSDYVYLGRNTFFFLTLEKTTTRGKGIFRVKDCLTFSGDKKPVPRKQLRTYSFSDVNLYTFSEWESSAKDVVKIGKSCFLKRKPSDPEGQSYVPKIKPYVFPEWIHSICTDILTDSNVLLTGDHGSGKSTVILQIAARVNSPCVRIQCSSDMTVESFLGGYVPSPTGGAMWSDGLLTKAARYGWWVILDEFDTCNASVRTILNGVLEVPNRILSISDKDGGEILSTSNNTIHHNFRIFCTGNSFGSNSGNADFYGGTLEQNIAQNSRFNIYHIHYLSEAELFKVIRNEYPELNRKQIKRIVTFATLINTTLKFPGVKFSTRTALAVGKKMRYGSSFEDAIYPCFINHFEESIGKKILKLV